MRIEIRGRNVEVTDELREHVTKRFRRVGKQVSDLAMLDAEPRRVAAGLVVRTRRIRHRTLPS